MSVELPRGQLVAEMLQTHPSVRVTCTGHCMTPLIHEGDTLELASVRLVEPRVGDAVAFLINDNLKVHRLVRLGDTEVRTSPDVGLADAPVPRSQLLGTVTHINGRPQRRAWAWLFRRVIQGALLRVRPAFHG